MKPENTPNLLNKIKVNVIKLSHGGTDQVQILYGHFTRGHNPSGAGRAKLLYVMHRSNVSHML